MKIPRNIKSPLQAFIKKNLKRTLKKKKEMAEIRVEMKHINPYDREIKKMMRGKTGRIKIIGKEDSIKIYKITKKVINNKGE